MTSLHVYIIIRTNAHVNIFIHIYTHCMPYQIKSALFRRFTLVSPLRNPYRYFLLVKAGSSTSLLYPCYHDNTLDMEMIGHFKKFSLQSS
nr:MAG TPA: hypothetical protein [Caudoviricetes sp.]